MNLQVSSFPRCERVCSHVQSCKLALLEGAPLGFGAQDLSIKQYRKVAAAIWNAIQCYHVIYDEKKSYYSDKKVDRTEAGKEPEPVPAMSGMSEIAVCPPSTLADDPSAPPSPTSSLSSVSDSCVFTQCQSLYVLYCTTALFRTVRLQMCYFVCVFALNIFTFLKSIVNLLCVLSHFSCV